MRIKLPLVAATMACVFGLPRAFAFPADPPSVDELIRRASRAVADDDTDQAFALLDDAVRLAGRDDPTPLILRGRLHYRRRNFSQSVADYTAAMDISEPTASTFDARGAARFCSGEIDAAITDFDSAIKLEPLRRAGHWQRGIAYYYAGEFQKGKLQFEGYQTVDQNDVENAVWCFMCMAREIGVDRARDAMLEIGPDRRVPMRQVYDLYAGTATIDDVFTAVGNAAKTDDAKNSALFYAHLYVGIYHDLVGEKTKAIDHLRRAVDDYEMAHYMYDVARIHLDTLRTPARAAASSSE